MPFTTQWLQENRIIRTQLLGKLSEQEAKEMSAAHAQLLDAGTAPVHLVVDVTGLDSIPINLRQNTAMGEYLRHPSLGWTVHSRCWRCIRTTRAWWSGRIIGPMLVAGSHGSPTIIWSKAVAPASRNSS